MDGEKLYDIFCVLEDAIFDYPCQSYEDITTKAEFLLEWMGEGLMIPRHDQFETILKSMMLSQPIIQPQA